MWWRRPICWVVGHDSEEEVTFDGPVPGMFGGFQRWIGRRWTCRRCGHVFDTTFPPWIRKPGHWPKIEVEESDG